MVNRNFWINKISGAWKRRSLIWLSGVRQVGKTTLSKMIKPEVYLNCDLPSVVRQLEDPELFLNQVSDNTTLIFDEIQRLEDPSRILKIATDEYPTLKILATGSSSLTATKKFRDTLTGRKIEIFLPPVLWSECLGEFNRRNLDLRLIRGGLPAILLSESADPEFYAEWVDSFYARDIQELFTIRQRTGFLKLFKLLLQISGGLLQLNSLSKHCGLSRPTVNTYLEALQIANAIYLLPPFHGGGRRELLRQPKIYAFDTGFVAFQNGWSTLRPAEKGLLWEHLTLDTLRSLMPAGKLYFWRDKSGREIDFVLRSRNNDMDTFECKLSPDHYNCYHLDIFRGHYPQGKNYLICPLTKSSYRIKKTDHIINVISLKDLMDFSG